jgi:hypothetical protein
MAMLADCLSQIWDWIEETVTYKAFFAIAADLGHVFKATRVSLSVSIAAASSCRRGTKARREDVVMGKEPLK